MADKPSNERLTAAAEELLKAAGVETSANTSEKLVADLESLKQSIDAKCAACRQPRDQDFAAD